MIHRSLLLNAISIGTLATSAHATTLFSDNFDADGTVNGSVTGWTKTGSNLFGGIGTEVNANHPANSTSSGAVGTGSGVWAYFQTNASSTAGMYRSIGSGALAGQTLNLTFDFGGESGSNYYQGVFIASLWDGDPLAGGTQLGATVISPTSASATPSSGSFGFFSLPVLLTANTVGNVYIKFDAGVASSGFQQAIVDNVSLTSVPEPSTYGLIGASALAAVAVIRRRRARAV